MKYQVGDLIHFQENDTVFETEDEAQDYAMRETKYLDGTPYGIWIEEDGELVGIAINGELFTK